MVAALAPVLLALAVSATSATSSASDASAASDTSATSGPAVAVMPLLADGAVSVKQAHGVTALIRAALADALVSPSSDVHIAKVLADIADDDKNAQQCQRDAACLGAVADIRGADEIVSGSVAPAADGLHVALVLVRAKARNVATRAEATLQGNDGDVARLDRLVRTLVDPGSLRGTLVVTGDAGAHVVVDGRDVGALPIEPMELAEGDHVVKVTLPGYDELTRKVAVMHKGTSEMKAVLLGSRDASAGSSASATRLSSSSSSDTTASHTDAIVVGSIGVALAVVGGAAGAVSLHDALDVENRAKAQQLAFPTDSGLLERGQILAYTADALYVAAVVAGAAAVGLWLLDGPADGAAE